MAEPGADVGRYEAIFALPVFIPFEDDWQISAGPHGGEPSDLTTLHFRRTEAEWSRPYHAIKAIAAAEWGATITDDGPDSAFRDRITVVVASTPAKEMWDDEPHEELEQPYFVRILRLVAGVVEAFGLVSGKDVPRLGPTTMFPVLITRTVGADGKPGPATVSILATEETARRDVHWTLPMSQDDIVAIATTQARLDRIRAGRPYFIPVRLMASAERSFIAREPEAAIVESSSAVEAMVNETVRSLAAELGFPLPGPRTPFSQDATTSCHGSALPISTRQSRAGCCPATPSGIASSTRARPCRSPKPRKHSSPPRHSASS